MNSLVVLLAHIFGSKHELLFTKHEECKGQTNVVMFFVVRAANDEPQIFIVNYNEFICGIATEFKRDMVI